MSLNITSYESTATILYVFTTFHSSLLQFLAILRFLVLLFFAVRIARALSTVFKTLRMWSMLLYYAIGY